MKFTSELIKKAWAIRRASAIKFGCKVMEISWAICLKIAKGENMNTEQIIEYLEENDIECNLWENYGKKRIYCKYAGQKYMKRAGYLELKNGKWSFTPENHGYESKYVAATCKEIGIL